MGKPIKVGDLVIVVRPTQCCNKLDKYGVVFKVLELGIGLCKACKEPRTVAFNSANGGYSFYELLRIDPPATDDSLPTRTTPKEPA